MFFFPPASHVWSAEGYVLWGWLTGWVHGTDSPGCFSHLKSVGLPSRDGKGWEEDHVEGWLGLIGPYPAWINRYSPALVFAFMDDSALQNRKTCQTCSPLHFSRTCYVDVVWSNQVPVPTQRIPGVPVQAHHLPPFPMVKPTMSILSSHFTS